MKRNFVKFAAAAALVAGAVIAAPAAATAATYPDEGTITGPATITIGGSGTFTFAGFEPGTPVTFTLTGEFALSATFSQVRMAVETATLGTKTAAADTTATGTVTLPSNATGTYTLTASGVGADGDPLSVATTFSVAAAAGGSTLPPTGGDSTALLGLWIGGGALVLAGTSIAVASTVRRHRNGDAAAA